MPPLTPLANLMKMQFKFSIGSDLNALVSTHWLLNASNVPQADLQAIAAHANVQITPNWGAVMAPGVVLTEVICQDMSNTQGAIGTSSTSQAGGLTGSPTDAAMCVLINHVTNYHYRGGHGRSYMPWGNGSVLATANSWTSSFQTLCGSTWSSFKTNMIGFAAPGGTSVSSFGIVSYFDTGTWKPTHLGGYIRVPNPRNPPIFMPSATSSVALAPATQRRRLRPG
jgi:hypothetical protein